MMGNLKYLFNNKAIQILVTLLIIVILIFVIFKIFTLLSYLASPINSNVTSSVSSIKDIFNILFYIIIATITILSYSQAKKTLFTPIRTEVFKLQIKIFEEILAFFQGKTDLDFKRVFDFHKILHLNAFQMADDYIQTFFKNEIEIDMEQKKEIAKEIVGGVVLMDYSSKYLIKVDYVSSRKKNESDKEIEITNPSLLLNSWRKYKYARVGYTKNYMREYKRLEHFIASPLLPQQLKTLLTEFKKKIDSNLLLIAQILTEISQGMPDKFPNADSMESFNPMGIWNKYHPRTQKVDEDASKILTFINDYFKIENLID